MRLVGLVAVAALSGCVLTLKAPDGALVSCGPAASCPEGFVCKDAIALCVSTANKDDHAPALLGAPQWSAQRAKRGDKLRVTFALDEVLGAPVEVVIDPDGEQLRMEPDGVLGDTLSFAYVVTGNEKERDRIRVVARAYDRSANLGQPVLGELAFDFTAPIAQFDWVKPKTAFKQDDIMTASGTVDADAVLRGARLIGSAGSVRLLTNVLFRPSPGGVQTIGVVIDLQGEAFTDRESIHLELDVEDDVGNAATAASTDIALDFTPPTDATLMAPSSVAGTLVNVYLNASDASEVFIAGSGVQETTNSFKWLPVTLPIQKTIVLNPGEGPRVVTASYRDVAGNVSALAEATVALLQDNQGPVITAFSLTSPTVTNDRTVRYSLTATDNQSVATYLVQEAVTPGLVVSPYAVSGVTGALTVTGEGAHTLRAWVQDINGLLSASQTATMTLDETPPVVTGFSVAKSVTNKSVVGITTLTGADANGVTGFAVTTSAVTPGGFASVAPTGVLLFEGANTLYPWVVDTATNNSTLAPSGLLRSVFYDSQPPSVASFTLTGPAVSTGVTLPFSISVSDPSPSSSGFGYQVTTTPVPTCTPGVTPTGVTTTTGPHTFYAWACDAANNVSAVGPTGSACVALGVPVVAATLPVSSTGPAIAPIGWVGTTSDCGVARYLITEQGAPAPTAGSFSATVAPTGYVLQDATLGTHLLSLHVLDVVGRIGTTTKSVLITEPQKHAHPTDASLQHRSPVAAVGPSGAFIAWLEGPSGELVGSWLDETGLLGSSGQTFSNLTSVGRSSLHVAANSSGDYAATWTNQPSVGMSEARGRFFHSDGLPYAGDFLLGSPTTGPAWATVGFLGVDAAFVWQGDGLLFGSRVSPGGGVVEVATQLVAVPSIPVTPAFSADTVAHSMFVVWPEPGKLYGQWFAGAFSAPTGGGTVNLVFSSDGTLETPDVSVNNDRAAVCWRKVNGTNPGIYISVAKPDGSVTVAAQRIEAASASVGAPTVSASASSFSVIYAYDDGTGQGLGIRLRRYDYSGTLLATFVVNDTALPLLQTPTISHGLGPFTIPVWEREASASVFEVIYKRYVLPP